MYVCVDRINRASPCIIDTKPTKPTNQTHRPNPEYGHAKQPTTPTVLACGHVKQPTAPNWVVVTAQAGVWCRSIRLVEPCTWSSMPDLKVAPACVYRVFVLEARVLPPVWPGGHNITQRFHLLVGYGVLDW